MVPIGGQGSCTQCPVRSKGALRNGTFENHCTPGAGLSSPRSLPHSAARPRHESRCYYYFQFAEGPNEAQKDEGACSRETGQELAGPEFKPGRGSSQVHFPASGTLGSSSHHLRLHVGRCPPHRPAGAESLVFRDPLPSLLHEWDLQGSSREQPHRALPPATTRRSTPSRNTAAPANLRVSRPLRTLWMSVKTLPSQDDNPHLICLSWDSVISALHLA